jgi:hypothetical protein
MRIRTALFALMVFWMGIVSPALSGDWKEQSGRGRWWQGDYKGEYLDGPCQVKTETKRGEFKREVKCKDGVGARWRREWKKEYWDGSCKVKLEAKRDEFKEEVKCE